MNLKEKQVVGHKAASSSSGSDLFHIVDDGAGGDSRAELVSPSLRSGGWWGH